MPAKIFAAVDTAAPVMAYCTICSWEESSDISATATPVTAPAIALFFCNGMNEWTKIQNLGQDKNLIKKK